MKPIEAQMTEFPYTVTPRTTISDVKGLMTQCEIRHLPVVDQGKVVGIISDRDLKSVELLADSMTLVASDVMTPDPYCVPTGTPLGRIVRNLAAQKLGSAIVLNEQGRVAGIFTTTDAMRLLAKMIDEQPESPVWLQAIELFLSGRTGVLV